MKDTIANLLNAVISCIANKGRFVVHVHWEGKCVEHYAKDRNEVLEWMSCYPKESVCYVYNRWDKYVGCRVSGVIQQISY